MHEAYFETHLSMWENLGLSQGSFRARERCIGSCSGEMIHSQGACILNIHGYRELRYRVNLGNDFIRTRLGGGPGEEFCTNISRGVTRKGRFKVG